MNTPRILSGGARVSDPGHRARRGATIAGLLIAGLIARLGVGATVPSATVTLAWDPPTFNVDGTPLTELAGYKIHYGTASRDYTAFVDVGPATSATLADLPQGVPIYFVVTCYSTLGSESTFSEELAWMPPVDAAPRMLSPFLTDGPGERAPVVPWSSVTGTYYTVTRSTNLTAVPAFMTIAAHIPGQSSITMYTDATATGNGPYYYRVQVEP